MGFTLIFRLVIISHRAHRERVRGLPVVKCQRAKELSTSRAHTNNYSTEGTIQGAKQSLVSKSNITVAQQITNKSRCNVVKFTYTALYHNYSL